MTDAGWAERHVLERRQVLNHLTDDAFMLAMVKAEHARSVLIIKAEMKRVKLDQYTYRSEERCLILGSLETVLNALQRGRGGKG